MINKYKLGLSLMLTGLLCNPGITRAQKTTASPPTDSSAQANPIQPAPNVPAVDASAPSSPVPEPHVSSVWLPPHTSVPIALRQAIDSGKLKNGQTVPAQLTAPVAAHGKTLPAGTRAVLTVIATVPAGKLYAAGEISLQLISVGGVPVSTDTQTFRGKPGPRPAPDAFPVQGTDASLPLGAALTFHVLPPPTPATGPPANMPNPPGSVSSKQ